MARTQILATPDDEPLQRDSTSRVSVFYQINSKMIVKWDIHVEHSTGSACAAEQEEEWTEALRRL